MYGVNITNITQRATEVDFFGHIIRQKMPNSGSRAPLPRNYDHRAFVSATGADVISRFSRAGACIASRINTGAQIRD